MVILAGSLVGCDGEVDGRLVSVFTQQATIDGEPAGSGDPIAPGAVLATNATGSARFTLRTDVVDCHLLSASMVEVLPTAEVLVRVRSGDVVCNQPEGGGPATFETPSSSIEVEGSTVVIEAGEGGSTVGSLRGSVQVAPAEGSGPGAEAVQLLPMEETRVPPGGRPATPRRLDPAQWSLSQQAAVRELRPDPMPATSTTGPGTTSSSTTAQGSTTSSAAGHPATTSSQESLEEPRAGTEAQRSAGT